MKVTVFLILTLSSAWAQNEDFTKANNLFAPDLYKEILKKEESNFLVSPFSAETILSLTQSGCRNESGQELRKVLHLPDDSAKIETGVKSTFSKLKDGSYSLSTVNKLYIKNDFAIKEEFVKGAIVVYQSETEAIDFGKKEEAAKTMNNWVEKKTENKIKNLIQPNTLSNKTRVILINALYFKGKWSFTFPPLATQKAKFYKKSEVVEVDTMYLSDENFLYFECPHLKAQILEIPFKGEDASMTIILPNEKQGLASLESSIDKVFTPHNLTLQSVDVALPKFRVESQLDFTEILQNLGVNKIFDENEADLSGIAGQKGQLVVSEIVQKTCVEVNEFGVEAAAGTYVPVMVNEMAPEETPKQFIADHPFIFYIKVKGVILFAGRVVAPSQ